MAGSRSSRGRGAAGGAAGGGELRRFAILSAWAWGAAAALTAVCVTAHGHAEELGLYPPSLFETRTCLFEVVYTEHLRHGKVHQKDDLGTVYYFYAPMGVLVVVNAVCLGLTMCTIRSLRKDANHVQRAGASTAPALRSAVLYVKLLLTAGVVELAVEGVAWGARKRRFHGSSEFAEEFAAQSAFIFAIVGTCLDVARAAAVLWLCVGRCSCASLPGGSALVDCCTRLRHRVSRLSLRRISQPATASTGLSLKTQEDPTSSSDSSNIAMKFLEDPSSSATIDSCNSAKTSTLSLQDSALEHPVA